MRIRSCLAAVLVAPLVLTLAACGGDDDDDESSGPSSEGACAGEPTDLLAEVCEEGVLTVSTDPAYPPQSRLNEQTGEYEGFDLSLIHI